MKTTVEHYRMSVDALLVTNKGITKEEVLLFNEGVEVVYFESEVELESEKEEFNKYIHSNHYEVKMTLKTINERIAVVLCDQLII